MGLNERLLRLEARRASFATPRSTPPIVNLLIKSMDAQRRELDGRPPDPGNEIVTPEEEEADREATRRFLPYLQGERERARASPEPRPELDGWISEIEAEIVKLNEEDAR